MDTFLEAHDFTGKTVIPFATSGGSGIGRAERRMMSVCPEAAWKPGVLLNGVDQQRGRKASSRFFGI